MNLRARVSYLTLVVLLFMIEIAAAGLMWLDHSIDGTIVHGLLGLGMFVIGVTACTAAQQRPVTMFNPLKAGHIVTLMFANVGMLMVIAIHDCDHMRQAMGWGYRFTLSLLLINVIVYLPNLISLYLIAHGRKVGIWATLISGLLIGGSFLKLHLLGAWLPVWGPWNQSFFVLRVDVISWWILVITAVAGVLIALIAAEVYGETRAKV